MKRIAIKDLTGSQEVEVGSGDEGIVILQQNAGSMSFMFLIRPEQAKELAAALLKHAAQFEHDMPLE